VGDHDIIQFEWRCDLMDNFLFARRTKLAVLLCSTMFLLCTAIPLVGADGGIDNSDGTGPSPSPTAEGKNYVILSTVGDDDEFYQAAQALHDYRGGEIIEFDPQDLDTLLGVLKDPSSSTSTSSGSS
jgi:hypothetical protein